MKKGFTNKFKNLKIKYKKDKKKYIVLVTSLFLMFSFIVGTSYAYLTYISKTDNTTLIEAGTLALKFYNESNEISLEKAIPQENNEAIENNEEYEFTVKNDGSIMSVFKLTLDNNCNVNKTYDLNGNKIVADKCIPNKYIKVALKEGNSKYEVLEYEEESNTYILDSDYLKPGETRNYKMKVWLSLDTPNDYNSNDGENILYSGKLGIDYEQGEEEYPENSYIIKYNANGGEGEMATETTERPTSITIKENTFTRTGYTFEGWSLEKEGEATYQAGDTVSNLTNLSGGIVNFYAIWEPITYTVVYNPGNATGTMESTTHTYDVSEKLGKNTFVKEDWIFVGWSTESGSMVVSYEDEQSVENLTSVDGATVNLYAVYIMSEEHKHTIVYNANGGTGTMANSFIYGSEMTLPLNTYTRTGYTFKGWDTSSAGKTVVYTDRQFVSNIAEEGVAEVNLYAVWEANTYTITYYTYDGSTVLGTSTHTYDTTKALTTIATLGGTAPSTNVPNFYGWSKTKNSTTRTYTNGDSIKNLTSTKGENINVYAIWRSKAVTLTWISGVNSATKNTTGPYYYYNGATGITITTPTPASISSWTTLGWRDDTTAGAKEWTPGHSNKYSASATYYAVYSRTHTGTFYSGVSKATATTVKSTAYYNTTTSALPTTVSVTTPTAATSTNITNWTELGWRNDTTAGAKEYSYGTAYSIAWGTTTFYGVYSRTLTISYNGNSATSGSTSNTTATVYLNSNSTTTSSQAVTLRANGFTRTGYTFNKWAVGSASGTKYAASASYNPGLAYNASTFGKTMYATWTIKSKDITFKIAYDTSDFTGPSSTYKSSDYQKLSTSSTTLNYGSSTSITASPAYPDDRYEGSVSCTNSITATLTEGSGTTARTDTIKVTNNVNNTTASVCTITYTPKWQGIAYGSRSAGATLTYGNKTWTVKSDSGSYTGLVLNGVTGSGKYKKNVKSDLNNSTVNTDISGGGIKEQSNGYYVTTNGGIKTNYVENYNYWTDETHFYNAADRPVYTRGTTTYLYGSSNARGSEAVGTNTLYTSVSKSTTILEGIKSTTSDYWKVSSSGVVTFYDTNYSKGTSSWEYAKRMTRFRLGAGTVDGVYDEPSSTQLAYVTYLYSYDDGTYTLDETAIIGDTAKVTTYICGGNSHGDSVVYRYNSANYFYYANEATGTSWSGSSFSVSNAMSYRYIGDNDEKFNGRYAGRATTCGTDAGEISSDCIEDYASNGDRQRSRKYRFHNFREDYYCYARTYYNLSDTTRTLYYRPYILVRER